MLHRYDISLDGDANCLSIKEFAVVGKKLRKNEYYDRTQESYSLVHEVSYDSDLIRAAITQGQEALISEIRTDYFFPVYPLAKLMAEEVAQLFDGSPDKFSELFFDDLTLLSEDNKGDTKKD
jgi:hypothetical protein